MRKITLLVLSIAVAASSGIAGWNASASGIETPAPGNPTEISPEIPEIFPDIYEIPNYISEIPTEISEIPTNVPEFSADISEIPTNVPEFSTDISEIPTDNSESYTDNYGNSMEIPESPTDITENSVDISEDPAVIPEISESEVEERGEELRVYGLTCEQLESPVGIDSADPRLGWKLQSLGRGTLQTAYQILAATSPEALEEGSADLWDSGVVRSDNSIMVPYAGRELPSAAQCWWKVRVWDQKGERSEWSAPAGFVTGILRPEDWGGAKWIALEPDGKVTVPALHGLAIDQDEYNRTAQSHRLPQFRRVFPVGERLAQALLYVTGLGQFDCFLNGEKVGDHFLDPGWTKYDREALYVGFDVTQGLKAGQNVLGVMLGNGFYHIPPARYYKLIGSFGAPKMRLCLVLRYEDGTEETIVSDASWKATDSPITFSSIYGGEDYDATLEQSGWKSDPAFDDSRWESALEVEQDIVLKAQTQTPLKVRQVLPTVTRFRNEKGDWIYDLGQNASGIVRLSVQGEAGQSVTLRPAELLNADGTANQSATGSPYYFKYTLAGNHAGEGSENPAGEGSAQDEGCDPGNHSGSHAPERWQPQFTYYGFRYVQVEGAVPQGEDNPEGLPVIVSLEGLHTCNSAEEAGTFICSKPMFNSIYNLIDWAIRSNLSSVTTDCPHREKLGWQEQNHLMQYSMQYRYKILPLYRKIIDDLAASQREDGAVTSIAPEYVRFEAGFEDSPEWGSSFIISPWYLYLWYGDIRPISTHYPAMKKYVDYLTSRSENHIVAYGLGDWFDIGPNPPGRAQLTSLALTCTAMYYYDALILSRMAALLGEEADARTYSDLAVQIRRSYNDTFFSPETGSYDRGSQCANALSLYLDLPDPDFRGEVIESLVADIRGRDNALTAGDIGYRYVLRALEESGRSDIIFDMNSKYDVPGYGWQLAHGATALTESWQAYENVSNNHLMLGHLMEWLFGGLGGLRQSEGSVAFRDILIDPQIVGDVTSARTTYESPYGRITCEWSRTPTAYTLRVDVPANCRAVVCLPTDDPERITEYGAPVSSRGDITPLGTVPEGMLFGEGRTEASRWAVGSGSYLFEVRP